MRKLRSVPQVQSSDTPRVLIVGGERNGHGTRICRKVVCNLCAKVDYVAVSRTKKDDSLYCRDCAKSAMSAFEKGTKIKPVMEDVVCNQCSKAFEYPKAARRDGPLLCSDCYKGFETWRGSLAAPVHERGHTHLSRRPAGTVLRSNK